MSAVSKKTNKLFITLAISLLAGLALFAFKTYAEGDAYLSDSYIEIKEGQTYNIMLTANNAAGRYSVSTDGTVSANGSGWLDNESVEISIYGGAVGSGTVTVNLDDFATYDEEPLAGARTVTVNVVPADDGYAGEERGNEEQAPVQPEETQAVVEEEAPADPTLEARKVNIDGVDYILLNDIAGIDIPAGFKEADATYNGVPVKTLKFEKDVEVYLLQKVDDGSLVYKVIAGQEFKDPNVIYQADQAYFILDLEEGYVIPDGFMEKSVTVGNGQVKGFVSEDADRADFSYVRVLKDGKCGIYSFDTKENSIQRTTDLTSLKKTGTDTELENSKKAVQEAQKKERALKIGLIDAIVLLVVFAVIMMIILVKRKKRRTVNDIFKEDI